MHAANPSLVTLSRPMEHSHGLLSTLRYIMQQGAVNSAHRAPFSPMGLATVAASPRDNGVEHQAGDSSDEEGGAAGAAQVFPQLTVDTTRAGDALALFEADSPVTTSVAGANTTDTSGTAAVEGGDDAAGATAADDGGGGDAAAPPAAPRVSLSKWIKRKSKSARNLTRASRRSLHQQRHDELVQHAADQAALGNLDAAHSAHDLAAATRRKLERKDSKSAAATSEPASASAAPVRHSHRQSKQAATEASPSNSVGGYFQRCAELGIVPEPIGYAVDSTFSAERDLNLAHYGIGNKFALAMSASLGSLTTLVTLNLSTCAAAALMDQARNAKPWCHAPSHQAATAFKTKPFMLLSRHCQGRWTS